MNMDGTKIRAEVFIISRDSSSLGTIMRGKGGHGPRPRQLTGAWSSPSRPPMPTYLGTVRSFLVLALTQGNSPHPPMERSWSCWAAQLQLITSSLV
jgi:hypothetical protein